MTEVVERSITAFVAIFGGLGVLITIAYVLNVWDQIQKRK